MILLRLGATPAVRVNCLKAWLDDVALSSGVPARCLTRDKAGTRVQGMFFGMLGFECQAFEAALDGCRQHMRELSANNELSWGKWCKTISGGRGNCTTHVLAVGMFTTEL